MVAQWKAKGYDGGLGATSGSQSVAAASGVPGDENLGSADGNTPSLEPGEASSGRSSVRDEAGEGGIENGHEHGWYDNDSWGWGQRWTDSSWSQNRDYGWSWWSGWHDDGWRPNRDEHVARAEETTWVQNGKWQGRTGHGAYSLGTSGSTRGEEGEGQDEQG